MQVHVARRYYYLISILFVVFLCCCCCCDYSRGNDNYINMSTTYHSIFKCLNIYISPSALDVLCSQMSPPLFVFVRCYTAVVLGVILQIAIITNAITYNSPFLAMYALTLALWATTMIEFWKRKERCRQLTVLLYTFILCILRK